MIPVMIIGIIAGCYVGYWCWRDTNHIALGVFVGIATGLVAAVMAWVLEDMVGMTIRAIQEKNFPLWWVG